MIIAAALFAPQQAAALDIFDIFKGIRIIQTEINRHEDQHEHRRQEVRHPKPGKPEAKPQQHKPGKPEAKPQQTKPGKPEAKPQQPKPGKPEAKPQQPKPGKPKR